MTAELGPTVSAATSPATKPPGLHQRSTTARALCRLPAPLTCAPSNSGPAGEGQTRPPSHSRRGPPLPPPSARPPVGATRSLFRFSESELGSVTWEQRGLSGAGTKDVRYQTEVPSRVGGRFHWFEEGPQGSHSCSARTSPTSISLVSVWVPSAQTSLDKSSPQQKQV